MKLSGSVVLVQELSPADRTRMFSILDSYFEGVSFPQFARDLQEKDWAVVLRDVGTGTVQGFSTMKLMNITVSGQPVWAVFSGDTIIEKEYWGEWTLARVWLNFVVALREQYRPYKFYWFLISMGYKTYRFLPVYFDAFYPCCTRDTPVFEKQVLDSLAQAKFGEQYNQDTGIIHFDDLSEKLKRGVAEIDDRRIRNSHIRFFIQKNSGYNRGDQLACLAEISVSNLKKSAFRIIALSERMAKRAGQ